MSVLSILVDFLMRFITASACIVTLLSGCTNEKTTATTVAPTSNADPASSAVAEGSATEELVAESTVEETTTTTTTTAPVAPSSLVSLAEMYAGKTKEEVVAELSASLLSKDAMVWERLMGSVYMNVDRSSTLAAILPVAIHQSDNSAAIAQSASEEIYQIIFDNKEIPSEPAFVKMLTDSVDFDNLSALAEVNMWINGAKDVTMHSLDIAEPLIEQIIREQIQTNGAICHMLMELFPRGGPINSDDLAECKTTAATADQDVYDNYKQAIAEKYNAEFTAH